MSPNSDSHDSGQTSGSAGNLKIIDLEFETLRQFREVMAPRLNYEGFFVATSAVSPGGVPIAQDPINFNFDLGYEGDTLASLDILDAIGVYGYEGLTRFGFNFWQGFPDNIVMECDFQVLSIEEEGVPTTASTWGAVKALYK